MNLCVEMGSEWLISLDGSDHNSASDLSVFGRIGERGEASEASVSTEFLGSVGTRIVQLFSGRVSTLIPMHSKCVDESEHTYDGVQIITINQLERQSTSTPYYAKFYNFISKHIVSELLNTFSS